MIDVRMAHTADLDAGTRTVIRTFLDDAFEGDFDDDDWEHTLGGMHAMGWEAGDLIGHAAVVQRRLLHGGRALRTGYVEGVGVRADRRRRGYGAALMASIERVIRDAYDLGALGAGEDGMAFSEREGGRCGKGRRRSLLRRASSVRPRTTGASTCCR